MCAWSWAWCGAHTGTIGFAFILGNSYWSSASRCRLARGVWRAGLTISAKFRRNFGKFFVSASYRDSKFRYFSVYFIFKFKIQQISTEIQRNSPKFTEISEQNSVSAKTGIWPENEMVNPGGWCSSYLCVSVTGLARWEEGQGFRKRGAGEE